MAKRKKVKTSVIVVVGVIMFFAVHIGVYTYFTKQQPKEEISQVDNIASESENTPLINQIKAKDTIYMSDNNLQDVRVEPEYWDKINFFSNQFKKVRKPSKYDSLYEAYTDNGIRFSTDLEFFRIYTVNKEEFYKIPVEGKKEFEQLLKDSMYTSIDSVKKYKSWKSVEVSYGNEVKKIKKWKYDDLAYKISVKRLVGKIQPEKSKERSKYNFTINIEGEGYAVTIETMGKEYVKVVSNEATAYYEVHTGLYEYIKDSIFKIQDNENKEQEDTQ
ncbi:MAG: hypothetical protein ACRDB0_03775 [Paraclostridium sp.]